jgi:hypothetical protein
MSLLVTFWFPKQSWNERVGLLSQVWHHPPPVLDDMRMLRWWTSTFAFHTLQHAARVFRTHPSTPTPTPVIRLQMLRVSDTAFEVAAGIVGESGHTAEDTLLRVAFENKSVLCTRGDLDGTVHPLLASHGVRVSFHFLVYREFRFV